MKMAEIKNSYRAIQISQYQGPISIQLSMKTIITFCSIWAFFGYKWVIVNDQEATANGWKESIGFPGVELFPQYFEKKKKSLKKSNMLEACQTISSSDHVVISSHIISF